MKMSTGNLYINGKWLKGGGTAFTSDNPSTGTTIWQGNSATAADVDAAVSAARNALREWSWKTSDERLVYLKKFQSIVEARKDALSEVLAQETGKALWDAKSEIGAMVGKLSFTLQGFNERTGVKFTDAAGFKTALRHKPHGVVAVYGPYNFPAHLPNGHILPALLAGNTVIFKPSELTPLVAEKTLECWHEAGIPAGVVNLVQGERETGKLLSQHPGLDGLFFTGSSDTGKILHKQFADAPHKILALELGGNNPLVVHDVADAKAAAYWTVQSGYMTTGQRCTCARRLIVPAGKANDVFIDTLIAMAKSLKVGVYSDTPEPFMGPLISNKEADRLLAAQQTLLQNGGKALVEMKRLDEKHPFVSAALIDMTAIKDREDKEYFGPLLQLIRVADMKEALEVANQTQYGLSSGIFTDQRENYEFFLRGVRAGVVNWNRPLTGSSGNLPFGGVGLSGNHRPAAYYSVDYCAYPVSSNEAEKVTIPAQPTPGVAL
jgi:succinylglutamic semialdehyde dehydrogenase